jgi:hypothetical protein
LGHWEALEACRSRESVDNTKEVGALERAEGDHETEIGNWGFASILFKQLPPTCHRRRVSDFNRSKNGPSNELDNYRGLSPLPWQSGVVQEVNSNRLGRKMAPIGVWKFPLDNHPFVWSKIRPFRNGDGANPVIEKRLREPSAGSRDSVPAIAIFPQGPFSAVWRSKQLQLAGKSI